VVIVLENADIMPHNLLVGSPGSLTELGLAAEAIATSPDAIAKHFIPDSKKVLFATRMVQPRETARLQFTAPKELGEYPYLCTFPGHWRIMRGVMHVVPKLADISPEELNPPLDVVAESRPFVRKWTVEDLAGELGQLDRARSFENGKAMFTAASCVKCHKLAGQGGAVGPDLGELAKKLADKKHTPASVLTELIEPSKVIDPKFRAFTIQTEQGEVLSGLVLSEDAKTVRIVAGADSPPRDVPVADIEERIESKISMMPEGLLVTLTQEDILDLMAYVMSGGDAKSKVFVGGKKPVAAGHEHHQH
jgi:putative heme-binding domain-containing protein